MRSILLAVTVALATVGCASTIGPRLQPGLAGAPSGPIECGGGCKTEWERAQLWLAKHSSWKVQTATDVVLTTYNPSSSDPSYGFSVTKEPIAGDRYRVSLSLYCGNMFGCDPEPGDVRRAFFLYVSSGKDALEGMGYLSAIR